MGIRYGASNPSISPNLSNDNFTVDATSGVSGKILEVHWGGEVTTTTAMHTRVCRASAVGTTGVAGNVAKIHPNSATNRASFFTGWSAQPTLATGDLFAESWNAHGGVVRWLAAPGEEFIFIGAADIDCRNTVGTATSSYGVIWEED